MAEFDYHTAFSRNVGWLIPDEQELLRTKRVAIAGLGGVGGSHLLTLIRLGISRFHISDLDVFEEANFNRQAGAMMSTLDQPKAEVLKQMALDIKENLLIDNIGPRCPFCINLSQNFETEGSTHLMQFVHTSNEIGTLQ